MARILAVLIGCSALYGFAMGAVHSLDFALRNLVKFPALILLTSAVCAVAYYLFTLLISRNLSFVEVQRFSLRTFRDISLLLASLAPVGLFLARTLRQPDAEGLHDYPFFLGLNVFFIALCGSAALVRRGQRLLQRHRLDRKSTLLILAAWLGLSLFVGAQAAWYLRPFAGVSTIPAEVTPFFLGTRPDIRGDTNFYQAVYHLLQPPPLAADYHMYRW